MKLSHFLTALLLATLAYIGVVSRGPCRHNGTLLDDSPAWTVDITKHIGRPGVTCSITVCKACGRPLKVYRTGPGWASRFPLNSHVDVRLSTPQ